MIMWTSIWPMCKPAMKMLLTSIQRPRMRTTACLMISPASCSKNFSSDLLKLLRYSPYAFAQDPNIPTVTAKPAYSLFQNSMGQTYPSFTDVVLMNELYKCYGRGLMVYGKLFRCLRRLYHLLPQSRKNGSQELLALLLHARLHRRILQQARCWSIFLSLKQVLARNMRSTVAGEDDGVDA